MKRSRTAGKGGIPGEQLTVFRLKNLFLPKGKSGRMSKIEQLVIDTQKGELSC
jgi:hypothetical protein